MTNQDSAKETFNMFKNVKVPTIDFKAAMAAHRKNLEAMQVAQKELFSAAKTISQANIKYMKESAEDFKSHLKDTMASKNLEEKVRTHTTRLKDSLSKATAHTKNLAETFSASRKNIANAFSQRASENMEEARSWKNKTEETFKKAAQH